MRLLNCFICLGVILLLAGCKKSEFDAKPFASLKIVNVVAGGTTAKLNSLALNISNNPTTISNSTTGTSFALPAGNPDIYIWPSADSLSPYYNSNKGVVMAANEYFTLFIGGTSADPQSVLINENYKDYTDSIVGIRFVNMSPNSTPVNVTLSTSTTTNQFSNVAFKDITDFKQFPATSNVTNYTFQVRRASSPNTVLSSVSISLSGTSAIPRFKNVTIVFRGNIGGSPAPGITRVNHY